MPMRARRRQRWCGLALALSQPHLSASNVGTLAGRGSTSFPASSEPLHRCGDRMCHETVAVESVIPGAASQLTAEDCPNPACRGPAPPPGRPPIKICYFVLQGCSEMVLEADNERRDLSPVEQVQSLAVWTFQLRQDPCLDWFNPHWNTPTPPYKPGLSLLKPYCLDLCQSLRSDAGCLPASPSGCDGAGFAPSKAPASSDRCGEMGLRSRPCLSAQSTGLA